MDNTLAVKLDPKTTPDAQRQQAIESMTFNPTPPDPELWRTLIPLLEKEPVKWIRQLEVRLLKRFAFNLDYAKAILSLLDSPQQDLRYESAVLLDQIIDRVVIEKNTEAQKAFTQNCLDTLLSLLNKKEIAAHSGTWNALYKVLANIEPSERIHKEMVALLPQGGDEALYVFAQYVHGKYPPECMAALLAGIEKSTSDPTTVYLLRGLNIVLSKEGPAKGYPTTESMVQTLASALHDPSENIRREAAAVLASRAKAAKKEKTTLPLEDLVWDSLFELYSKRLASTTAYDKDQARNGLAVLPVNPDRLVRLFKLLNQVDDELQKQNVVGLIGGFKTPETRAELLRMLKENFAALRLEAQRTTLYAVSAFLPDEEIEAEMDKLLEGKGLHADIQATLADKLFAPLPSLKKRLMYWLGLNEKTKRPMVERFDLPMMHIKIIQSAGRLSKDEEILARLNTLEPLLMMNDAKVKLHETLKAFAPKAATDKPEAEVLTLAQVGPAILKKIETLPKAKIVFVDFTLPQEYGASKELEFGNTTQTHAQGLSPAAAEMGKDFVKKAIEDLFSDDSDLAGSSTTQFQIVQDGSVITVSALT